MKTSDPRRVLPLFLGIGTALLTIGGYYAPDSPLARGALVLTAWVEVIAACAIVAGLALLGSQHLRRVWYARDGWWCSAILLIGALSVLVNGLAPGSAGPNDGFVRWAVDYVYLPIGSSLFALLGVYAAVAAYRILRVRSSGVAAMTLGAVSVFVLRSPLSAVILPAISGIGDWLLRYPITGAKRAIVIGTALGLAMAAIRFLLARERRLLG
ncbi:MAG TPA: hypothetical protein VKY56_07110 [Chloroflexota bacterium]|nr:hypothetical protein [Chloroflexota bacterium]